VKIGGSSGIVITYLWMEEKAGPAETFSLPHSFQEGGKNRLSLRLETEAAYTLVI
jgi:hypothetical protein